jgi:Lrp/AsnC family transcriptional regulator, leucine-responsive regulatory protein
MTLDAIDRKILMHLQENARITNAQLSKEVGLSPAPTLERVKKLEQSGYIAGYHAEINRKMVDLGVCIFLHASLVATDKKKFESFKTKINNIDEVVECHHITGSSDFLIKIYTKDIDTYNRFVLDKLIELEEIGNLQSIVVLDTYKESKVLCCKDH